MLPKPQLKTTRVIVLAAIVIGPSMLLNSQATTGNARSGSHSIEFEVASIRPADPGSHIRTNIALNIDNTTVPPGGRLSATFPLTTYIEFAYKIMPTKEQEQSMLAHAPDWVRIDNYTIEARADGNPTKDDMRLMMQSLLAERFKLAVHSETHEVPVLAFVLVKAGKPGPRLRSHADGQSCEAKWTTPPDRTSPSVPPGGFLPSCGTIQAISGPNNTVIIGARNVPLSNVAPYLSTLRDFGRPLVDQTGLSGTFDFSLNWSPEPAHDPMASAPTGQPDTNEPDLLEALKDQLGLRLQSEKAPIQVLVIDHVERPSPN